MYLGEVNVAQEELNSFLAVAEDLRVKGLTQGSQGGGGNNKPPPQPKQSNSVTNLASGHEPLTPPPKRPRPIPQTQNTLSSGLAHQSYNILEDDDIQEVVPVKTEPREHPLVSQQTQPSQPQQVENQQQYEDQLADDGTVALEDSYGDESYDYGQYEGYEDVAGQNATSSVGADGNKGTYLTLGCTNVANF